MRPISLYKKNISLEPRLVLPARKSGILLSDNNPEFLSILETKLEEKGYMVLSHEDKRCALVDIERMRDQRKPFPLVISNIMSYPLDGFEFLKRARSISPNIKFIFCSACGNKYILEAKGAGANAYVRKPSELGTIYESIIRVLRGDPFFNE
jgi:CheY-like chemotaxis protein